MDADNHLMPCNILQLMPCNTLQLISIQHELLLCTGLELKLETMLHSFMLKCLTRLSLRSIHVYCFLDLKDDSQMFGKKAAFVSRLCSIPQDSGFYPHNHREVYDTIKQFDRENPENPVTIESNDTHYLIFHIKDFGVLVLDKLQLPGHISITDVLAPVVDKLAMSCQACVEHMNLKAEIEARVLAEKASERSEKLDPLTNLSNRRIFQQRLFQEIARSQRHKTLNAVLHIGLDHFNKINDSLGHSIGDKLLTEVAHRLRLQARAEDSIFRIGGDEFVIMLNQITATRAEATHIIQDVAQRLCDQIAKPVIIHDHVLHTTASIGIVLFPDNTTLNECEFTSYSEEIVQHAGLALVRAKQNGRNGFKFFRETMQQEAKRYHAIETQLRKAISNNELDLFYQPLVDCNESIIGAEALLRWNSPVLGNIAPDEFIPIAEESGLIIAIGEWVLQTACSLMKEMQSMDGATLQYISVNISQKQFIHPEFVSSVKQTITNCGISPELIRFEITESLLINNIEGIILKMKELSEFGIRFLLDDFGTGYSSLSSIQYLPICCIKIDKTFITNIHLKNEANMSLTKAIISLANHINIACIAEGIESAEDAEFCKSKNVHGMQGYYFYRPLAKEVLIDVLTGHGRQQLKLA